MQSLLASGSYSFLHACPLHSHSYPLQRARRLSLLKPHCAQKQQSQTSVRTLWPWPVSLSLFGTGFFFGPLLDGLHSRVDLVVYRSGSIHIGPLHTNVLVGFQVFNFNFLYTFNAPLVPAICISYHHNILLAAVTLLIRLLHN